MGEEVGGRGKDEALTLLALQQTVVAEQMLPPAESLVSMSILSLSLCPSAHPGTMGGQAGLGVGGRAGSG